MLKLIGSKLTLCGFWLNNLLRRGNASCRPGMVTVSVELKEITLQNEKIKDQSTKYTPASGGKGGDVDIVDRIGKEVEAVEGEGERHLRETGFRISSSDDCVSPCS